MQCDASKAGLGAVLLQKGQPVAFGSRSLTPTEQDYSQMEKEALAILYGCQHFEQYIYGRRITVQTDHKPLETIFKKSLQKAPKRLQGIMLNTLPYNAKPVYVPGKYMYIADILSRDTAEVKQEAKDVEYDKVWKIHDQIEKIVQCEDLCLNVKIMEQIRTKSAEDETLLKLKRYIQHGWPDDKSKLDSDVHIYFNFRDELSEENSLIFIGGQIIVPRILREEIMRRIHSDHSGLESNMRRAKDTVFWPFMRNEVRSMVENCETCNKYKIKQQRETLMQDVLPTRPWEKVGMDLFQWNNKNFLIISDYFSNYFEMNQLTNISCKQVISYSKAHFARYGIPEIVVSDQGTQFMSSEFKDFSTKWEFEHRLSSPYHHQAKGKPRMLLKQRREFLNDAETLAMNGTWRY